MDLGQRFERRVSEHAVAQVLDWIAAAPNRRKAPTVGDLPGEFSFWFDGGAATVQTGYVEYVFADGTKAEVGDPIPALSVSIEFANGCRVTVQQHSWGPESNGPTDR